ncbi:pyridoxamine 5'-phosphate oxidase family protein [Tissierella sp.]|uniref:pyridoxamine 5'-phosphate oxidase family protein n=1 Tax=Tissierella sp. TaxID=41274 RepID=UPI00285B331B|nr:pyridoxamine 5'-phosphate oxidase family protein [Tissierella sp.]MDR7857428.1 pyridoxamine 5'-phosphate oxidase family protein [Tissierella sp.]
MRRKDREMSREFGIEVIDKSSYGVASMIGEDNEPYGVPLSIVRDGDNLYFHSAMDGRKVKIFEKNSKVSVSFIGEVKVPENYTKEELDEIAKDESKARLLISNVLTTEYESAIVKGKINLVEDEEEKIKAIRLICEKYTPTKMDYFNLAIKSGLKLINVYKIGIQDITAKRKKYDSHGEEMKWGRME